MAKAQAAYGPAICRDWDKAISRMQERPNWLEHCMGGMHK